MWLHWPAGQDPPGPRHLHPTWLPPMHVCHVCVQGPPADAEALAQHVATYANAAAGVLLDCTASDSLPQHYTHWLGDLGLHIITPNKQLGSGPLPRYHTLRQLQLTTGA